jgi:hypothetical protein
LAERLAGRRLFFLMNSPVAAEVEQVWGRSASSGLATGRTGVPFGVLSLRILVLKMAAEWLMALVLFLRFSGIMAQTPQAV